MKDKIWIVVVTFLAVLAVASVVQAGVVFEDNFDSTMTWNADNAYPSNECSYGDCPSSLPTGGSAWNYFRSVRGHETLSAPASIRAIPGTVADHTTGSTSGKAFVGWDQAVDGKNFPGDGILGHYLGGTTNHKELYIQFWMRTQSNWGATTGYFQKILRVSHWREIDNVFQWRDENTPIQFFDMGREGSSMGGDSSYMTAYRCEQKPYSSNYSSDYYCGSLPSDNAYQKNDYLYELASGVPSENWADTGWHRYTYRFKLNTPGSSDGVLQIWYDGSLMEDRQNVQWLESGASASTGWNNIAIGGNSPNEFSSLGEQWYAIDDFVVSTTPIAANYVPSGGVSNPGEVEEPVVEEPVVEEPVVEEPVVEEPIPNPDPPSYLRVIN